MMKWVRPGNSLKSVTDPGRRYLAKLLRFKDADYLRPPVNIYYSTDQGRTVKPSPRSQFSTAA